MPYRQDVLDQLWRHGVQPGEQTPPELVRNFVRELYKYEIRVLRERYMRQEFSKASYAILVDTLRRQYPVLSLHASQWVE